LPHSISGSAASLNLVFAGAGHDDVGTALSDEDVVTVVSKERRIAKALDPVVARSVVRDDALPELKIVIAFAPQHKGARHLAAGDPIVALTGDHARIWGGDIVAIGRVPEFDSLQRRSAALFGLGAGRWEGSRFGDRWARSLVAEESSPSLERSKLYGIVRAYVHLLAEERALEG